MKPLVHGGRDISGAPAPAIARKLVGEILRASARVTASRNALLLGAGMTGPRLRVLKMIRRHRAPRTVSQLARDIGVSRQTLQAIVRDLVRADFVELESNVFHRRAPLVVLTQMGTTWLDRLVLIEREWVADLTRGFDERLMAQTEWMLRCLRERVGELPAVD